jgi:cytochrome P450
MQDHSPSAGLSPEDARDAEDRIKRAQAAGCPVVHFDYTTPKPALSYFSEFDKLRAQGPTAYSTYGPGFWMLLTSELVREAYQTPEIFSSSATIPTVPHPDWQWIPTMIDPPLHGEYRRMMNIAFSPRFVRQIEDSVRQDCVEAIESFLDKGQCDFIEDFAKIYPTKVFLRIVGLPLEDTELFMGWVETIFEGLGHFGDEAEDQLQAQREIHKYFEGVLKDRRENPPANPEEDFFSIIASSQINGRPITDEEFLNMSEVLLLAGLDTIKSQLSYIFYHLAITPKDREWIVREPEIIPNAIEEFLRAHNIVMTARQVAQDTDFHGCPMKKGDMVMVANPSASRDEAEYDNPTEIQFDRQVNRHYSFAGGPHRCAGAHLARREMAIAIEEWHKRIPEYRVLNTDGLVESGPQVGIEKLVLGWDK